MNEPISGVVVVHFDEEGDINYRVYGDASVRLFIVDERAPDDRVYEWTERAEPASLREVIPEGAVIGSSSDERHAAIAARILNPGKHLRAVDAA